MDRTANDLRISAVDGKASWLNLNWKKPTDTSDPVSGYLLLIYSPFQMASMAPSSRVL